MKKLVLVTMFGLLAVSFTCVSLVGCGSSGSHVSKNATRDVDPDPNFLTGPNAVPGEYVISLVDQNLPTEQMANLRTVSSLKKSNNDARRSKLRGICPKASA